MFHPTSRVFHVLSLLPFALSALHAQAPDNLWLRPSDVPGLNLHSGAMVLAMAAYPGSDEARAVPFPILNGDWKERFSFGASRFGVGGGAAWHPFREGPWTWTVGAEATEPRPESLAHSLAGMGHRPATVFASSGIQYQDGPFKLEAGFRKGLREEVGGGAVLRATVALPLGRRWLMEARVAGSAYDRTQMAYEYGVSPEQAARRATVLASGDGRLLPGEARAFASTGGWALLQSSLALGYAMTDHWRLGLTLLQQEVQGAARNSPLVRDPRSQGVVFGIAYQL